MGHLAVARWTSSLDAQAFREGGSAPPIIPAGLVTFRSALDTLSNTRHTKRMMTDSKQSVTHCAHCQTETRPQEPKTGPVEVWLRQINLEIVCTVANEDESTDQYPVDSLSLRGAQREMTGYFISQGYEPVGRWEIARVEVTDKDIIEGTEDTPGAVETVRRFRVKK